MRKAKYSNLGERRPAVSHSSKSVHSSTSPVVGGGESEGDDELQVVDLGLERPVETDRDRLTLVVGVPRQLPDARHLDVRCPAPSMAPAAVPTPGS